MRTLAERKVSLMFRIAELRERLRAAETADAELSAQIEAAERRAERGPETTRYAGDRAEERGHGLA